MYVCVCNDISSVIFSSLSRKRDTLLRTDVPHIIENYKLSIMDYEYRGNRWKQRKRVRDHGS